MTAITANRVEKNVGVGKRTANYDERSATDKYWNLLPIILLIIWAIAAKNVFTELYHDEKPSEKFDFHDTKVQDSSDYIDIDSDSSKPEGSANYPENHKIDSEDRKVEGSGEYFGSGGRKIILEPRRISLYSYGSYDDYEEHETFSGRKKRSVDETIEHTGDIWGLNWAFDTFMCNVAFLDKHYEDSGSGVIWINVLFCVSVITYSLASINTDKMYRAVLSVFALCFACTIIYRFFYYIRNVEFLGQTFDATLCIWVIPEVILFIIAIWKFANTDEDSDTEEGTVDILRFKMRMIGYAFIITLPLLLFIVPLVAFAIVMYQSNVDGSLFYPFVGIICYLLLITHYFTVMVISCAIILSMDLDRQIPCIQDFLRAWNIVARYHFGTACYHATIIMPRIKTVLVMYEKEFKEIPRFTSVILMHREVQHRSLMTTAAAGYDHSKYMRNAARLFIKNYVKKTHDLEPVENCSLIYSHLYKCCSILLIAINSLLIIGFWTCDVTFDSSFVLHTWIMYVSGMCVTYVMGGLFDLYVDARWYYSYENTVMILS